jgi:tetratricopeptide (TPR) repeat protein
MPQDISEHAKVLYKEVETYRAHCLFVEARKRSDELVRFIRKNEAFDAVGLASHLSARDKALIRRIFSSAFEEGSDASIFEAGNAFLVFGQFKEALAEFRKLIKSRMFRMAAVKNIFRCYIGLSAVKQAVALYLKLHAAGSFPPEALERVRYFLQSILKLRGINRTLPKPIPLPQAQKPAPAAPQEVLLEPSLDVLSIKLVYPDHKKREQTIELDVNFQKRNTISVIVPGSNRELIEHLKPGMRLDSIELRTTDLIFMDTGVVHARSEIRVGDKRGDHTVTLRLDSG